MPGEQHPASSLFSLFFKKIGMWISSTFRFFVSESICYILLQYHRSSVRAPHVFRPRIPYRRKHPESSLPSRFRPHACQKQMCIRDRHDHNHILQIAPALQLCDQSIAEHSLIEFLTQNVFVCILTALDLDSLQKTSSAHILDHIVFFFQSQQLLMEIICLLYTSRYNLLEA